MEYQTGFGSRPLPLSDDLSAFVCITRYGSITQAAEALCISPTTAGARLRRLERWWGDNLVDREQRPLKLTRAGLAVYPYVIECLQSLQRLDALHRDQDPSRGGQ